MTATPCKHCHTSPPHPDGDGACASCAATELGHAALRVSREAAGLLDRASLLASRAEALLADVHASSSVTPRAVESHVLSGAMRAAYPSRSSSLAGVQALACYLDREAAQHQAQVAWKLAPQVERREPARAMALRDLASLLGRLHGFEVLS